jgi:hypothetical protein
MECSFWLLYSLHHLFVGDADPLAFAVYCSGQREIIISGQQATYKLGTLVISNSIFFHISESNKGTKGPENHSLG